jgi:hypothetical protein
MSKEGKKIEVRNYKNMERENVYRQTEALVKEAYGEVRQSCGEVRFMDNKERAGEILANLSVLKDILKDGTSYVDGKSFLEQRVFVASNFVRFGGNVDDDFKNNDVVLNKVRRALVDRSKEKNVSEEEKTFLWNEWFKLNN